MEDISAMALPCGYTLVKTVVIVFGTIIVSLPFSLEQDEDIPHNEVKNWALKFGVDLWEFGRQFTKMNEVQRKYHEADVEVARKDGLILIREMAAEVKNMMDIKMNAVLRIMDSAEQAALSHKIDSSFSSKYSQQYSGSNGRSDGSRNVFMRSDDHFDQLPVNTNFSSVFLPSSIKESESEVQNGIKWSEYLDLLFVNNYEMDPSLSWQYFGSASGFLRRYPAIKWPPADGTADKFNFHDFRTSSWYIDAATSSKDIVILLDSSSSMNSKKREVAKAVANSILDTLGNNDFINIFRFSESTTEIVPCFKDSLVQATAENIRELRLALNFVKYEGSANFSSALITGFEILHRYNRTGQGCQCNQAIMLITDGPSSSYKEIFKQYNWPHMPVRIFTYLTGRDGSNADDMNWMACANKGYYARVETAADAKDKVLQYIAVLARPMVLYQHDHPVQWTPVYAGGKPYSGKASLSEDDSLMTSVSTPIFDRRNYSERTAKLLGVVGTDVPISQIKKLVPAYKLGVNGYSFIVDNNGHILYHPDLRPLLRKGDFQEALKPNYNSVDLTQVELVDGESGAPMQNHTLLLDLRHEMIDQKEGETELNVIIHYDNMKRVMSRRHRYFYNAIDGTPFSLGIALPEGYGMYEVLGEQEIKHSPVNVLNYFQGNNWKIHPDWIYCEYNYPSDHVFESAEDKLLHFLDKTHKPGWKWMSLRPRSPIKEQGHTMKKMEKDSYYCDKNLMQSLVYDAMVTEGLDRHSMSKIKEDKHFPNGVENRNSSSDVLAPFTQNTKNVYTNQHYLTVYKSPIATLMALLQRQGYQMFGVTTSFVATRSGLLRWKEHGNSPPDFSTPHFSETNRRAIDELWYKRAVHQHTIEPESFVFSVPFDADIQKRPLVTATHAVFVEHKGHRAPAAVVGLQFQHSTLASHFINITSACTGGIECRRNCASPELDCYVLDNNGFIILSESLEHTGKFFGQIDGTIMDSLVQDRIYKKVAVYDYQGACYDDKSPYSDSASYISPFRPAILLFQWILNHFLWLLTHFNLQHILNTSWAEGFTYISDDDDLDYTEEYESSPFDTYGPPDTFIPPISEPDPDKTLPPFSPPSDILYPVNLNPSPTPKKYFSLNGSSPRPCDKRVFLYNLQPDRLNTSGIFNPLKGKLTNCHSSGCERPFSVQKIPHSNLILLVVDTLCPCGSKQLSITPQEVVYDGASCRRKPQESMYRRRPPKCINYHPEEIEIHLCGRAYEVSVSVMLLATCLALMMTRIAGDLRWAS